MGRGRRGDRRRGGHGRGRRQGGRQGWHGYGPTGGEEEAGGGQEEEEALMASELETAADNGVKGGSRSISVVYTEYFQARKA